MTVYPKSTHLSIPMICSSSLGIFPAEFMFQDNSVLQMLYARYSVLMLGYYIFFLLTAYIKLFDLVAETDPRLDEISRNLCITLIYTATVVRQLIIKTHMGVRNLIRQVIDSEAYIRSTKDQKVIEIYDDCAKDTGSKCKYYLLILFIITMLYILRPVFLHGYYISSGNSTYFIKNLPLSSWFPFDEQVYYLTAYVWHIFDSLIGASFVTYTDILMFSLIVYPTGQIRILHHILKNFSTYMDNVKRLNNIENDEDASYTTFRECIRRHKEIIRYVDNFNESMSILMIFDFLQSSLQIATILTQILGNPISLMLVLFVGAFFLGMILRLILYYYYANDVIVLSSELGVAIWESNWYEQPPKVKFMMHVFMMRSQKALKLFIGPFSVMSLDSFIAILKATYSYIMLMYGVN